MAVINFRNDARISPKDRKLLRDFCSTLDSEIVQLANDLGVKVFAEDLLPYESGYVEHDQTCGSKSGFKIVVNANHKAERQRFTVAHELAHFLLHKDAVLQQKVKRTDGLLNDPFSYIFPRDRKMEREANLFASSLLLPPNNFKPAFERLNGDIGSLARLFCVSEQVVERRINELDM